MIAGFIGRFRGFKRGTLHHDAILAILRPAGEHTLKSILRVIGAETDEIQSLPKPARGQADAYGVWQGKALQAGIRALLDFGGFFEDAPEKQVRFYLRQTKGILKSKEIGHPYD